MFDYKDTNAKIEGYTIAKISKEGLSSMSLSVCCAMLCHAALRCAVFAFVYFHAICVGCLFLPAAKYALTLLGFRVFR